MFDDHLPKNKFAAVSSAPKMRPAIRNVSVSVMPRAKDRLFPRRLYKVEPAEDQSPNCSDFSGIPLNDNSNLSSAASPMQLALFAFLALSLALSFALSQSFRIVFFMFFSNFSSISPR